MFEKSSFLKKNQIPHAYSITTMFTCFVVYIKVEARETLKKNSKRIHMQQNGLMERLGSTIPLFYLAWE